MEGKPDQPLLTSSEVFLVRKSRQARVWLGMHLRSTSSATGKIHRGAYLAVSIGSSGT